MSNTTYKEAMGVDLICPLLESMKNHSLNLNKKVIIPMVCFHALVSCLGILENALILWVVGYRLRRRTVASVWVLNLAMSDFLTTLTLPLFTFYLASSHSWRLGNELCKIQASIFYLNMFVSAFLLAAISLDRYLLVAKPVWSQNHRSVAGAWKVCALGWLFAVINALPYFLFRTVIEKHDKRNLCYHNFAMYSSQDTLKRDCKVRQAGTAISKLLLAFVFPVVLIAGSYIKIGLNLKKRNIMKSPTARCPDALIASSKDGASGITNTTNIILKPLTTDASLSPTPTTMSPTISNQTSQNQLSQSFTKMVTFLITAFILCWAPYHITCLIEVMAQYWQAYLKLVEVAMPIATSFAFLNPVLNPILYAFSCPKFSVKIRESLGAVFVGLVEEGGGLKSVRNKTSQYPGSASSRSLKTLCACPFSRQEEEEN